MYEAVDNIDYVMPAKVRKKGRKIVKGKESEVIAGVRKLIKYGESLAITLPPEWVEKHGLKPGDEVPIVADSILKIVPVKEID